MFAPQRKERMTNRKRLIIALVVTGCYALFLGWSVRQGKDTVQQKLATSLVEAAHACGFLKASTVEDACQNGAYRSYLLMQDGTATDTISYRTRVIRQSELSALRPLAVEALDSAFRAALQAKGIHTPAGIISGDESSSMLGKSSHRPVSPSVLHTLWVELDVIGNTSVQGWADGTPSLLWTHIPAKTMGLLCWIAVLDVLLFYGRKGRNASSSPILPKRLRLDTANKFLYIDERECPIKSIDFDLLNLFLHTPGHYLSRDSIKQALWPKEVALDDRLNSHISTLRTLLKEHRCGTIVNFRGKGYRLELDNGIQS